VIKVRKNREMACAAADAALRNEAEVASMIREKCLGES